MQDRLQALQILLKLTQEKISLSELMDRHTDLTGFAKELCFGVCRHYYRLQTIANLLLHKKKQQPLVIWLIILIGLYQLHYMQKSVYAIVHETVSLLDFTKKKWAKGLVNAILRTFCRKRNEILTQIAQNLYYQYGHPLWFITRLQNDWPHQWSNILQANDELPPLSLRINCSRITRTNYLKKLANDNIEAYPHVHSSVGITLKKATIVTNIPGFTQGEVSVQDESAQLAITLLQLQPDLRVLDACCAPGSKICHILETEDQLNSCIGLDVNFKRLQQVQNNLTRLNLHANIIKGNALNPGQWWDGQLFDRILLDAPCSATGVIRRHPDIKLLRNEEQISRIVALQSNLLQTLWPLLSRHGLLIYATCSVLREENDSQIANFMSKHADCKFLTGNYAWGVNTAYGWQILPHQSGGDGFFYSRLQKE